MTLPGSSEDQINLRGESCWPRRHGASPAAHRDGRVKILRLAGGDPGFSFGLSLDRGRFGPLFSLDLASAAQTAIVSGVM